MNNRILNLTVKRKWFDLIASGKKKIEYREAKPYWQSRLIKSASFCIIFYAFSEIHFRNGYGKDAPLIRAKWVDTGLQEIQPYPEFVKGTYFLIHIGEILEIKDSAKNPSHNSDYAAAMQNKGSGDWRKSGVG